MAIYEVMGEMMHNFLWQYHNKEFCVALHTDSVGHFKNREVSYHFTVAPRNTGSKTALVIELLWVLWWLSQNGHLNAKGIMNSTEIVRKLQWWEEGDHAHFP